MSKQHEKRNLFAELTQGIEEIGNYKKTKLFQCFKSEKRYNFRIFWSGVSFNAEMFYSSADCR